MAPFKACQPEFRPGDTMELVERVKRAVADDTDEQYTYRCGRCESEFESTEAHMGKVECPDCGSHDLRTVATG